MDLLPAKGEVNVSPTTYHILVTIFEETNVVAPDDSVGLW
jgi:hypothetical protein